MAERRMFAKTIINSARFLRMPVSSQLLYFHLGMEADDDGVVEAFSVMRKTGLHDDDLKVLAAKGFVKVLNEELVTYISDWSENNKIRADRKVDSRYKSLLLKLIPDVNLLEAKKRADTGKFTGQPMDVQTVSNGQPMDSIGKDSIGEDRIGKDSIEEYCAEPSQATPPEGEVFTTFLAVSGDEVPIMEDYVKEMEACYPAVDVRAELLKAKAWLINNPANRKTVGGMHRFIGNWLGREQNRAGRKEGMGVANTARDYTGQYKGDKFEVM